MTSTPRLLWTLCLLCALTSVACDDDDANNGNHNTAQDTTQGDTATEEDSSTTSTEDSSTASLEDSSTAQDSGDSTDTEDTTPACTLTLADCTDDKPRLVGCRCISVFDRRCDPDDGNADCREGETCTFIDPYNICMFTPPPAVACPGAAGCESGAGQAFQAAAVSKVITPNFETPKPEGLDGVTTNFDVNADDISPFWNDCGYDGLCPSDPGYPGPDDGEGDNIPQGAWLAGFDVSRPALYCPPEKVGCAEVDCCVSAQAHDDLKLQIVVMRQGDVTVGFISFDVIGFFHSDFERIKADIPASLGIDHVVFGSTHNHEGPDTFGQWGGGTPLPTVTGRDSKFFQKIHDQAIAGLTEAVGSLRDATVSAAVLSVGFDGLSIADSRPPYIINDDVPVVWLRDTNGDTIATLISLGNHAEVLWSDNQYITADYPGFTRHYLEQGLSAVLDTDGTTELKPALPGLGGVAVVWAGSVGGLINPGAGGAKNYAGVAPAESHSFEAADAVGQTLASRVLEAVQSGDLTDITAPDLSFARKQFLTPIDNTVFVAAATTLKLIPRDIYNAAQLSAFRFAPDSPEVLTEVSVVSLGPVTFFTAPGEVFPETLTGGYPGKPTSQTPIVGDPEGRKATPNCDENHLPTADDSGTNTCIVKRDQENPPDFSLAPSGPYVYDRIPGEFPFFIGLGMDALGYIVPAYDYEVVSYFDSGSTPGHHYEETNGVGPDIIIDWESALQDCLSLLP